MSRFRITLFGDLLLHMLVKGIWQFVMEIMGTSEVDCFIVIFFIWYSMRALIETDCEKCYARLGDTNTENWQIEFFIFIIRRIHCILTDYRTVFKAVDSRYSYLEEEVHTIC